MQEPVSQNLKNGQKGSASSSSALDSSSALPSQCDSSDHEPVRVSHLSSSTDVMTGHQFAQSIECWLWQWQCYNQHVNWMTWIHYTLPFLATVPSTAAVPTPQSSPVGEIQPNFVPTHFPPAVSQQQQLAGREYRVASISRRLMAEFIDFMLVFSVKLLVSLIAIDYGFNLFQVTTDAELEKLFSMTWDSNVALAITTEILVMEIVNRVFICIFETICLWKMGATPGKRMMNIGVISCDELLPLIGNRFRISPAGNISFLNALLRATIKNFSVAFFFPVCLTIFFFQHNRTMYDIVSGSIVVDQPDDIRLVQGRR